MKGPRLAELATKLLRAHAPRGSGHLGDRAAAVSVLERALAARAHRRQPLRYVLLGTAAAAALALVAARLWAPVRPAVTATWISSGGATFVRAGVTGPDRQGQTVVEGDRLHAGNATQVALSTGTSIAVAATSDIDVLELGGRQRLSLVAGGLRARVKKLRPNEEFSVATPDALISVRGTEFEVVIAPDSSCAGRSATHVRVFEGVVTVKPARLGPGDGGELRLLPSATWSTPCPAAVKTAAVPTVANRPEAAIVTPLALPRAAHAAIPATSAAITAAPPVPGSTLVEQNDLLERALAARRQGDRATALELLDDLLARFPRGPLAGPAARARRELAAAAP
jgi:hypothetical protein